MFEKNPLQNGVSRNINEYSQDLEDRVETTFTDHDSKLMQLLNWMGLVKDYVVETGENANGSYEKWNSGKLVQRGYDSMQGLNEGNAKNIMYPIPFANNQAQVMTQLVRNSDTLGVSPVVVVNRVGSTSTYFRAYHTSTNSIAMFINWEAIGRWK